MNSLTTGTTKQFTTPQYSSMILTKFLQFRATDKFCDVFISNDNTFISAHSFILAAASPFMMRYISSHSTSCLECSYQKRLDIPVTSITKMMNNSVYNCMDCVLKIIGYIYTGCIGIADAHFDHIVNMTCNLEIEELLDICRNYNKSKTTLGPNLFEIKSSRSDVLISEQLNTSCKVGFDSPVKHVKSLKSFDVFSKSKAHKDNKGFSTLSSMDINNDKVIPSFDSSNKEISSTSVRNVGNHQANEELSLDSTESSSSYRLSQKGEKSRIALKLSENKEREYSDFSKDLDLSGKYSHFDTTNVNNLSKNEITISNSEDWNLSSNECTRTDQIKPTSYKLMCSYCLFKSNSCRRFVKHLLKENHGNKCSICLKEFRDNENLIKHILSDHNLHLLYTCHECNLDFKSRHSFKTHLVTHENSDIQVKCDICHLTIGNKHAMKLHVLKRHNCHSEKTCEFCGYTTKFPSYLKRHLLKHYRKLLTCTFQNCNFSTVWKNNLKTHLKMHQVSEKEFKCDICLMQFSLKKNLQRHVSLMHNKSKHFTCPKCKYSNKRFDKLKAHYRTVHDEIIKESEQCDSILLRHNNMNSKNCKLNENSITSTPIVTLNHPNSTKFGETTIKDSNSGRVVYLNESTGELTFFCDSDGKPLQGVPDVITLHSIGGMKNKNNLETSNSASLFLNEITGELSCIQLNFNLTSDTELVDKPSCPSPEVTVTVLDETTGEITSKHEQIVIENDLNINDFDNIFDAIDFDAMNDDSFDGFDDFDNALFDAEFSIGPSSPDMDKILNEFTGELFTDQSTCQYTLDKPLQSNIWENKNPLQRKPDNRIDSHDEELAQIILDEVTGELIGELSSILN